MRTLRYRSPQATRWLRQLQTRRAENAEEASRSAEEVIREVRKEGDRAVSRSIRRFDHASLRPNDILLEKPKKQTVDSGIGKAIELSIERVRQFHEKQKQSDYTISVNGSTLTHRVRPLNRVGIYVPGGKAVYLSTLVMCAVPAQLAGVKEIVVATPPNPARLPELLDTCARLGVGQIYRAGGPAAIAAMAIGTQSLRRVDKIVGPGNRYVDAAKRLLHGEVGIDMTAGPTEIVIVADDTANFSWVAADMLAQIEHGEDSSAICVTTSAEVAKKIDEEVLRLVRGPWRSKNIERLIDRNGAVIVMKSRAEIASFVNELGPEHLEIQAKDAEKLADRIDNCGAIFLGPHSPVAAGDYVAGPNHVLPTAGSARFFSPLGVYDFYKRSNVTSLSEKDFLELSPSGQTIAAFEGLDLHGASLAIREGEES
ncbi:MAG: histidinol dehydrogenase [Acidobacteria bacterium]|nr:histidinol dehydrogenase [Acidobacteriota bacterium]